MKTQLTKSYLLRAVHKLAMEDFVEPLHGHHYHLEVCLQGDLQPQSQWIFSRDKLDEIVREKIIIPFDKTNLNNFFEFTSGEVLVKEFFNILAETPLGDCLYSVALQETKKNRFTCTKEGNNS